MALPRPYSQIQSAAGDSLFYISYYLSNIDLHRAYIANLHGQKSCPKHESKRETKESILTVRASILILDESYKLVARLLKNGASPNQAIPVVNFTPLHMATLCQKLDVVKVLTCGGAELNKSARYHNFHSGWNRFFNLVDLRFSDSAAEKVGVHSRGTPLDCDFTIGDKELT